MAKLVDPVFQFSNDDLDILSKAFQNKNFRECFKEFANSLTNSSEINHFETEVKKYEKQRGVDVKFLHPSPGIVLQTKDKNKDKRCFVNISTSEVLDRPSLYKDDSRGIKLSLPIAIPEPRLEYSCGQQFTDWLSKNDSEVKCYMEKYADVISNFKEGFCIYDAIVHPVCLEFYKQSDILKDYIASSILSSIYEQIHVDLLCEYIFPVILYIGNATKFQIRQVCNAELYDTSLDFINCIDIIKKGKNVNENCSYNKTLDNAFICDGKNIKPYYEIKYIDYLSLENYSFSLDGTQNPLLLRPNSLLLKVTLPKILSVSQINIQAKEKSFVLKAESESCHYFLDLVLSYCIDENPKSAKFDLTTHILEVEFNIIENILSDKSKNTESQSKSGTTNPDRFNTYKTKLSKKNDPCQVIENISEKEILSKSNKYTFDQCQYTFTLNINLQNFKIKYIMIDELSQREFVISYGYSQGDKIKELLFISVSPYAFLPTGISSEIFKDKIKIIIQKSKTETWSSILIGESQDKYEKFYIYTKNVLPVETAIPNNVKRDNVCSKTVPLLPYCKYKQNNQFLTMKINGGSSIQDFAINQISPKSFTFEYKCMGNGLVPLCYKAFVSTAPYAIKSQGLSYNIDKENVVVSISKKKGSRWQKIRMGSDEKSLQVIKLHTNKSQNALTNEVSSSEAEFKSHKLSGAESEHTEYSELEGSEADIATSIKSFMKLKRSASMFIPNNTKKHNYVIAGSWPRGILKSRNYSFSESQVDSGHASPQSSPQSSSFNDDFQERDNRNSICDEHSQSKKSVRFSDFVWKQIFRKNGTIVGQRLINQQKLRPKKELNEDAMPQSSQSSGTDTENEFCLFENVSRRKQTKNKGRKSKHTKQSVQISNQMVFQLDED